ncbi:MAG: hypothetical protein ACLPPF_00570 [Rhodomicrobium sp.]
MADKTDDFDLRCLALLNKVAIDIEGAAIVSLAAGQMKADGKPVVICF